MKIINKNNVEFEVNIGFDKFNSLTEYFGQNEDTGDIKGCNYNYETGIATFSNKMLPFIYDYFNANNFDTKCLFEIANDIKNIKVPIDISSKTIGTHQVTCKKIPESKTIDLYDEQYEYIQKICKRPYGLVSLYTGLGKGMLITYLATNYTGKGNICIIVPNLGVKEELQDRVKDCGLIYNNKVRFIHPAGFLNSNDKNNKDTIEWMNNVDMILMDEGENVSGSLNTIINKYCKNARIFYSFCGTADRFNNWKLSYENLQGRLHMLHQETLNLMYYFGTVNVYKTLPKKLNINRTYLPLPQEEKLFDWQQMQAVPKAVENVFNSDAFYQYLDYIEKYYSDKVLYIPVKTIEQGTRLLEHCNRKGYKAVFWKAGKITSTDNIKKLNIKYYVKPKKLNKEDIGKKFSTLKDVANKHKLQIIIGTSISYRGIDIKAITDVLLIIGASSSIVEQCVGRATRADEDIRVWLLDNANDRYVNWRKNASELSTPVWDGLQGAKMKQLSKLNVSLQEIDLDYPPNEQDKINNNKIKENIVSEKEQLMDKDMKAQAAVFELLKNRGK